MVDRTCNSQDIIIQYTIPAYIHMYTLQIAQGKCKFVSDEFNVLCNECVMIVHVHVLNVCGDKSACNKCL